MLLFAGLMIHTAAANVDTDKCVHGRRIRTIKLKLASKIDQFDISGCVGCGRCITWCPVGIDSTEEVAAIRGDQQ